MKKYVPSTGETTLFVYDAGGKLVAEYSTIVASINDAKVSYLTADHLGSPRINTDGSGNVTSRKDFMAFGEEAITAERNVGVGYGVPPVRQDYTGYEKEAESGLEFAQARYQNPVHGRFTSVDPLTASATIRNPQSFNRYTYALNSPYKFTDPLGLLSEYTSGACGGRCRNSDTGENSGPMTGGGNDQRDSWTTPKPAPPPPPPPVGEFVKTGEITFEYRQVPIPVKEGSPPANVNGQIAEVQIFWKAETGYVLASDGKTRIKATRAVGDIQIKIVGTDGNEFSGSKDAPIAASFAKAIDKVISAQKFDNKANCHGTTFANGKVWINNDQITERTMGAMGFRQLEKNESAQGGDVAMYINNGEYVHSAAFNSDGTSVTSKSGIEPRSASVSTGPGIGTAWSGQASIQVWSTRSKVKK